MNSARCSQKPRVQTVSGSASRKPPQCSACIKTTSWSWRSVGLVMGHLLHGHAEVHLVVNGFGDEAQEGLPQLCELRGGFFRASRLMGVRDRIVDEFIQRGVVGVEVA